MPTPTQHRLDPVELRVLGCLLEKQRTTPDQYPLSLNALRLACNQQTSRDPVMSLDEDEVRAAVRSLADAGWASLASGTGSRVAKYRQRFDESLDLLPSESAVLAVLFLRGPQTVNELRTRTERAHAFADEEQVLAALGRLAEAGYVRELERRPGQRETRWTHLLAEEEAPPPSVDEVVDAYAEDWNRGHAERRTTRAIRGGEGFALWEWTQFADDGATSEGVDVLELERGAVVRAASYVAGTAPGTP
jgi:uncharacterized protein YceH (UPF0502 family)